MRSKPLYLFSILVCLSVGLSPSPGLAASCQDLFSPHIFEVIDDVEQVNGTNTKVKRITVKGGELPLEALFGSEPQVIIGLESEDSSPYLIVGNRLIRIIKRTGTNLNVMGNTIVPVDDTISLFESKKAKFLKPGYFIRLAGLPLERIREIERSIDLKKDFAVGNLSETEVRHLIDGLANHGLELNCQKAKCTSLAHLLSRSIRFGYVDQGTFINSEFYLVNERSLADFWKRHHLDEKY